MECNRDAADRCIEIAVSSINSGQYEKAEKFLRKAENLFPSPKVKELLEHTETRKQIETVRKINNSKNYYKMLGITEKATNSEIRKAYRDLSLIVHPDKTSVPGATEAFLNIAKAKNVLENVSKREDYDLTIEPSADSYESYEYSNLKEDWHEQVQNKSSHRSSYSRYGVEGANVGILACVCVSIAIFYIYIYLTYSGSFLKQKRR